VIDMKVLAQVPAHRGTYVYMLMKPPDGVPFYVAKGLRLCAPGLALSASR